MNGTAIRGRRWPAILIMERVKKSKNPHYSSSFPRKRESRDGARKTRRRLYCRDARLDPRFRACEEIGRFSLRRSEHRRTGAEKNNIHPINTSSFPRKRESRGDARKTLRRLYCETTGLDSRFRGNDERLVGIFDFFTHSFAGMTKCCRWLILFICAESGAPRSLLARVFRFLHTLYGGERAFLGAPASRRHLRFCALRAHAGETPPASARASLLPGAAATDSPHRSMP